MFLETVAVVTSSKMEFVIYQQALHRANV